MTKTPPPWLKRLDVALGRLIVLLVFASLVIGSIPVALYAALSVVSNLTAAWALLDRTPPVPDAPLRVALVVLLQVIMVAVVAGIFYVTWRLLWWLMRPLWNR
ncbi:MAG: hypothetical protein ACRDJN_22520 [Chloroflexota bacterium]